MHSRFGLKDLILIALIVGVGVLVLLAMMQRDREWDQVQQVRSQLGEVQSHLARLEERRGPAPAASPPRDETWARPGVPIQWQEPWTFVNDPSARPGFRAGGEFTELLETSPVRLTPIIQTD